MLVVGRKLKFFFANICRASARHIQIAATTIDININVVNSCINCI